MPKMIVREEPGAMLRRLTPGRARVALFAYDDSPDSGKPGYRAIPGQGVIVNVRTATEAAALWRAVKKVVDAGEWKRDRRKRVGSRSGALPADVADLGQTG